MDDPAGHAAAHGFEAIAVLPSLYGAVVRVRHGHGAELLLKSARTPLPHTVDEAAALASWRGCPALPAWRETFDDGCHVRAWVEGEQLSDLSDGGAGMAREVGAMLRTLHEWPADGVSAAAGWLGAEQAMLETSDDLGPGQRERATRAAAAIAAAPQTLVHGDFYPRNLVVIAGGALVAIDPLARRDTAAADAASFLLTCPQGESLAVRSAFLAGYGIEPAALDAYLTWWAIRNLHYRGAFERVAERDPSLQWQPCYVASGDGLRWQV